jgi:hypothetical protein
MVAALVALFAVFPPFHVRKSGGSLPAAGQAAAFDAVAAARQFWQVHIDDAAAKALSLDELFRRLSADPAEAGNLGRAAGVGANPVFVVRGSGKVIRVETGAVWLDAGIPGVEVALKTGPLFGNVLRDAFNSPETAALSSFNANALSAELNRLAEEHVHPPLIALAKVGAHLEFLGCAQRKPQKDGRDSLIVTATRVGPAP